MQTKDFATQHTLTFLSNKNNFSKQPICLLTNNMGLTGDDFIALYKITRGENTTSASRESAAIPDAQAANAVSGDGIIGITIGSSDGLTSASGSNRINANSITAAAGITASFIGSLSAEMAATSSLLSITSPGTQYIVTMTMKGTDRIDVIVNDGVENTGDLTITTVGDGTTDSDLTFTIDGELIVTSAIATGIDIASGGVITNATLAGGTFQN